MVMLIAAMYVWSLEQGNSVSQSLSQSQTSWTGKHPEVKEQADKGFTNQFFGKQLKTLKYGFQKHETHKHMVSVVRGHLGDMLLGPV